MTLENKYNRGTHGEAPHLYGWGGCHPKYLAKNTITIKITVRKNIVFIGTLRRGSPPWSGRISNLFRFSHASSKRSSFVWFFQRSIFSLFVSSKRAESLFNPSAARSLGDNVSSFRISYPHTGHIFSSNG